MYAHASQQDNGNRRSSVVQRRVSAAGADRMQATAGIRKADALAGIIQRASRTGRTRIGSPGSSLERDADNTAERVVNMSPGAAVMRQAVEEEETAQAKPLAQRQAEEEEEAAQAKPLAQRQAEEEEEAAQAKPLAQRQAEEEEEAAQAKPLVQRQAEEEEVQAKGGSRRVSASLQTRLDSSASGGTPLPAAARSDMESGFGRDFSSVRIHTGRNAVQMSSELGAQAFTHRNNIYFNSGKYDPHSTQGKRLLAHELTHTVQQGAAARLARYPSTQSAVLRQEDSASEAMNMEAELAASAEEAVGAVDPVPAEQAREKARTVKPQVVKEAQARKAQGKEVEKKEQPEPEKLTAPLPEKETETGAGAKEKGGFAPAAGEEAAAAGGGVVSAYLHAKSAQVIGRAKVMTGTLAEHEKTHDPAEAKLAQTEAAVQPPVQEGQSRSNAEQVGTLDQAPSPRPDAVKAKTTLSSEVERAVPGSIKELNEFRSRGKAAVVGSKVLGKVKEDTDAVDKTYNAIEQAPPARPPEKEPVELPPGEAAAETGEMNLGQGAVPDLKDEHTDFSKFDRESDDLITKEGISDEQLAMVDEGDLAEANKERQGLKKNVHEQPARIKEFAVQEKQKVDNSLRQEETLAKTAMRGKRDAALTATKDRQKKTKTALEVKREAVTRHINTIYEKARKGVTLKLNSLEKQALRKFDQGQARFSREFEREVNRDVNAWKRKRYSGFWGPAKWLKDKLFGIAHFPEVKRAFDRARSNYIKKIDALIGEITAASEAVIKECKNELAAARLAIRKYVDGLGPELRSTGQQALADMKSKLAELDGFIDRRRQELVRKLAAKREEAIKKIDEKIEKMKEEMSGALAKLGNLLLQAMLKFFEWALKKAGYDTKQLMGIINKGKAVITKIVKDPIGFIKNIVKAVKTGIFNFEKNIKKHLIGGLIQWLTGAMGDIDIQLPEKFDLKGVLSFVLQILGLTWANIRAKLVKRLGEKTVGVLEKTFAVVKRLVTEGPMALWEMIKEKAAEIKAKVMEGIRNWAIVELVKQAIIKLVSFLNPAGAIIQAILAIYNTVMFFIENWQRIVTFVKTVFSSIADIAMGKISAAAAAVERAMAMTIPIILNFLARLLNLGGIGKAVKKIIQKIRRPIDMVLDKAINFIVTKAKSLFGKGKAAVKRGVEKVKELVFPQRRFKAGNESHTIKTTKLAGRHSILIKSPEYKVNEFIAEVKKKPNPPTAKLTRLKNLYDAWEKMDEKQPKERRKKEKAYSPIAKLIIEIMQAKPVVPETKIIRKESEPTFDGKSSRATRVTADPLTKEGKEGSPTTASVKVPGINTAIKEARYKVHLLHAGLHGPAEPWNLTAASQTINQRLLGSVERFELKATKENKVITHDIQVRYESDPKPVWKRDVAKHVEAVARDKETGAVIGSFSGSNYG